MSEDKELPELDIPDDDDQKKPEKAIFEKPASFKKSSSKQGSAEAGKTEGKPTGGGGAAGDEGDEEEGGDEGPGGAGPSGDEEGDGENQTGKGSAAKPADRGQLSEAGTSETVQPPEAAEPSEDTKSGNDGPAKTPGDEAQEGDQDQSGDEGGDEQTKGFLDQLLDAAMSGKVKATKESEKGKEGDDEIGEDEQKGRKSIPEEIMDEVIEDAKDAREEEMTPRETAESIAKEIATGEKPKKRIMKKSKAVSLDLLDDILFGGKDESPDSIAKGIAEDLIPPDSVAKGVVSDIISPEFHAKEVIKDLIPGKEDTAEGIAESTLTMLLPGQGDEDMDEDVSQYVWEGPCSSSSSSTEKTGLLESGKIDREYYIEWYKNLYRERFVLSRQNVFLQKKVYDLFLRKKLIRYFESIDDDEKLEARYVRELKQFGDFIEHDKHTREKIRDKLIEMEKDKEEAENLMAASLKDLVDKERECSVGLMNEITGKPLMEKTVERLLRRQRENVLELLVIRQRFIKLRDMLANKEKQLVQLETIGVGLLLRDYEQLRMENQSYSDKIEERDEELTRLRRDATSYMQILAHVREKANATTNHINELYESLEEYELTTNQIREHTAILKKLREKLRQQTHNKKVQAGLLVQHHLIRDFENSIDETIRLQHEIDRYKSIFHKKQRALSAVRMSTIEAKRRISKPLWRRNLDYQIFKELLYDKRQDMPADYDPYLHEVISPLEDMVTSAVAAAVYEQEQQVEPVKKGKPNFFPAEYVTKGNAFNENDRRDYRNTIP